MQVSGIALDPLTSSPIVILRDAEGKYTLPIWIGIMEASAIATEIEKVQLARPMTHDLIKNLLGTLGVKVDRVVVSDLKGNTFYALIHLSSNGKAITVDSRPSDAIAVALRSSCPIFVEGAVLERARQTEPAEGAREQGSEEMKKRWKEFLEGLSPEDFGKYKQ